MRVFTSTLETEKLSISDDPVESSCLDFELYVHSVPLLTVASPLLAFSQPLPAAAPNSPLVSSLVPLLLLESDLSFVH